jgi:hypothetical protein
MAGKMPALPGKGFARSVPVRCLVTLPFFLSLHTLPDNFKFAP